MHLNKKALINPQTTPIPIDIPAILATTYQTISLFDIIAVESYESDLQRAGKLI